MNWIEALILGIIQGLTEFLPVSSSGHLEIARFLLGTGSLPEDNLMFTVMVHGATSLSTIVVFRRDIAQIFRGLFRFELNGETRFAGLIILSMIPAAFVGLFFEDQINNLFSSNMLLVGSMLIITSLLLILADRARRTHKKVNAFEAFVIGVSQAIAILPGISRSGATISTSVLLGVDRERAARFSFLMVVPLILGKMTLDLKTVYSSEVQTAGEGHLAIYIVGFIAAFVAGLFACRWMIELVKRARFYYFAVYCFLVGIAVVLYTII